MGKTILRHVGITLLFLAFSMAFIDAVNAAVSADEIADKGYLATKLFDLERQLNTLMENVVSGSSVFTRHVAILFTAGVVIHIILAMVRYLKDGDIFEVAGAALYALFVGLIYATFSFLTSLIWSWLSEVGASIQVAMLGTDGLFAASNYITEILSLVVFDDNKPWWDLPVQKFFISIAFLVFSMMLSVASFFTAVWPMLGYVIIKPLGYFLVPALFFEKTGKYFDGFITLLIGFGLYVIIGRIILSTVALLIGAYMAVPFGSSAANAQLLIKADGFSDIVFLAVIMLTSFLMLIATPWFVSRIVGGGSFQISGGLRSLATKAARGFKGG